MKKDYKAQLLKFVDFHARAYASSTNSINGIVASSDVLNQIIDVFNILKRDYSVLFYSGKNMDTKRFLDKITDGLKHEKNILIAADTLDFDPILLDQLINFRKENRFNVAVESNKTTDSFPSSGKIFLFYQSIEPKDRKINEIADHVLNLSNVN